MDLASLAEFTPAMGAQEPTPADIERMQGIPEDRRGEALRGAGLIASVPAGFAGAGVGEGVAQGLLAKGIEAGRFAPEGAQFLGRIFGGITGGLSSMGAAAGMEGRLPSPTEAVASAGLGMIPALGRGGGKASAALKSAELPAPALDTPAARVVAALRAAKPLGKEQEAMRTSALSEKVGRAVKAGQGLGGQKEFYAQLAALSGEAPKVQFESLLPMVSQPDIDALFKQVATHPNLTFFDTVHGREGLTKLFGVQGGALPTRGELEILNHVFGQDFTKAVLSNRTMTQRIGAGVAEAANIPRSLMASFDLSAPFRQGVFFSTRKEFYPAFAKMFSYLGSDKAYKALGENIAARPTARLMRESGLALTDVGPLLSQREERFMSSFAGNLPGVKQSQRAYTGFLNKLRADVFDDLIAKGPQNDPSYARKAADFVNTATGRGGLGKLENSAVALNGAFFSPRLMASRIQLLNPGFYAGLPRPLQKEAAKSLAGNALAALTILEMAKLGGAEVGTDPRSADFGKIKVGRTRYDIFGGFQQYVRLVAQLKSGETVSSVTGRTTRLGVGYKSKTRLDLLVDFGINKLAPLPNLGAKTLKGVGPDGKPLDAGKEALGLVTPLLVGDTADAMKEWGALQGGAMMTPAVFGAGTQTYGR